MEFRIGIFLASHTVAKMIKDMIIGLGVVNIYESLDDFYEQYRDDNLIILDRTYEDTTAFEIIKNLEFIPHSILLTSSEYKKDDSSPFSFVLKKPFKKEELLEAISFVLKMHTKEVFKNKDVLVVDDSSVSRSIIKKYVKLYSFNPIEATNGIEALKILKQRIENPPVLIITDQEMPQMDGLTLADEIRKLNLFNDVPVIMISGASDDFSLREEAFKNGISDFISKPLNEKILKNIFSKYLEKQDTSLDNCKILLIDDSYTQRKAITSMLKNRNINVFSIENMETGLFVLNANDFDLLLIDFHLDDNFTAIEFLKKANDVDIPVIVYSSFKNNFLKENLDKLFEVGVNDYILMPFQIDEIIFKVKIWKNQNDLINEYRNKLKISDLDYLTGIMLRQSFFEKSDEYFSLARRNNIPLSLLYLDLDYFKKINDKFGHKTGDYVLKEFVKIVKSLIRKEDVFGRLGGEEFALLLPYTKLKGAIDVAEKIRNKVKEHNFKNNIKITVSIGIAEYNQTIKTFDELLNIADKKLYKAKESGRDRVVY